MFSTMRFLILSSLYSSFREFALIVRDSVSEHLKSVPELDIGGSELDSLNISIVCLIRVSRCRSRTSDCQRGWLDVSLTADRCLWLLTNTDWLLTWDYIILSTFLSQIHRLAWPCQVVLVGLISQTHRLTWSCLISISGSRTSLSLHLIDQGIAVGNSFTR